MSIFYNVRINGTDDLVRTQENGKGFAEFRETRSDNILDKQDDYQVGVVRLSIPSSGLPYCIMDFNEQEYKMGLYYNMSYGGLYENVFINEGGIGRMVNLSGEGELLNMALYNINNATPMDAYTPTNEGWVLNNYPKQAVANNILELHDDKQVLEVLNAGITHAFSAQLQMSSKYTFYGGINCSGQPVVDDGATDPPTINTGGHFYIKDLLAFTLTDSKTTATNKQDIQIELGNINYASGEANPTRPRAIMICDDPTHPYLEESLNNFYVVFEDIIPVANAGGTKGSLENLVISLRYRNNVSGSFKTIQLISNLNLARDNTQLTNRLILSPSFPQEAVEFMANGKMNVGHSTDKKNYCLRPQLADDMFGSVPVNSIDGLAQTTLTIENNGSGNIYVGRMRLVMCNNPTKKYNNGAGSYGDSKAPYQVFLNTFQSLAVRNPTFGYDDVKNVFQLSTTSTFYDNQIRNTDFPTDAPRVQMGSGNNVLFSYDLASLFKFNYTNANSQYANPIRRYEVGGTDPIPEVGYDIGINDKTRILYLDTTKKDTKTPQIILNSEYQNSKFLKKSVRQILIQSTTMNINGEYEQGNGRTIQILTDFEPLVDETYTIFQYQDSGYTRYYPLRSTLPLRDIGLKILYADKFGITRSYLLNKDDSITMKLEFRPNNMIYNFD